MNRLGISARGTRPALVACGGCSKQPDSGADKPIVLGFSQIGAESEWRTANTNSIKSAAEKAGIRLKFSDAQQKQENQIKALRSFIAQRVDVIAFSPVVETGWETVLREAKTAGIPVILTDRAVDVTDDSLYVTFMGSDFVEEGRKAGRWLLDNTRDRQGDINIVELQGTVGSAPANDRKKGFQEIIGADPRYKIIRSQTGDFTRAKGKEVMEAFLKAEGQADRRALRAQRRHGDRRDPGDRGSGPQARHRHRHHFDRRREGRVRSHDGRQAERHGRVQSPARTATHDRGESRGRGGSRSRSASSRRNPSSRWRRRRKSSRTRVY